MVQGQYSKSKVQKSLHKALVTSRLLIMSFKSTLLAILGPVVLSLVS